MAAARKAAESAWWQQAGLFDACGLKFLKRKEAPPPVFNIYRYARFERIKQLAQKNQKWYLIPLKYQYHSQSCNQK